MDHTEATLTWSGRAIDIDRIESELARLRYEAAGEPGGGHGFAIRTSLLNLVVYAEDEESVREAGQTIPRLSGHHPSRTLLVTARPGGGEWRIDAQLAAHCHIAAGLDQQVCCEEVMLAVAGLAAAGRLAQGYRKTPGVGAAQWPAGGRHAGRDRVWRRRGRSALSAGLPLPGMAGETAGLGHEGRAGAGAGDGQCRAGPAAGHHCGHGGSARRHRAGMAYVGRDQLRGRWRGRAYPDTQDGRPLAPRCHRRRAARSHGGERGHRGLRARRDAGA